MSLMLHPFLSWRRCLRCWKGAYKVMSTTASNRYIRPSHYDMLGVQENASADEIKQAFFGQCKKLHPDSDPANPNLHTRFVKLNEAYGVLSRESSRKEYDLSLRLHRQGFTGATRTDPFDYTSPVSRTSRTGSTPTDDERFWQQFHKPHSSEYSSDSRERRHRRNKMLVGYCVIIMLGSLLAHYVGFRTIKEVHSNFLEEQNRIFSKIYNDSKERARTNGLKKQQEILAEKHAQFAEKYRRKPPSENPPK
ncbi:dnaJ homolog subfamily C member 4 isoform X3 [Lissotriton helveticus]